MNEVQVSISASDGMKRESRVRRELPRNCNPARIFPCNAFEPHVTDSTFGIGKTVESRESQETCLNNCELTPSREGKLRIIMTPTCSPRSSGVGIFLFRGICFLFIPFAIDSIPGMAQDSLVHILSKEVVITATRSSTSRVDAPVATRVLTKEEMRPFSSLAELLSGTVGLDLRDYGANSGAKLLSIRGSTGEQVIVMINGVRLNNAATGVADLSLLSMSQVQRIEVTRGGASALYGSDGVGGVINIITTNETGGRGLHVQTGGMWSTFEQRSGSIGASLNGDRQSVQVYYEKLLQPDSSYRVNSKEFGDGIRRVNTRTRSDHLSFLADRQWDHAGLQAFAQYTSRASDVPGTIFNNSSALARARQDDKTFIVSPALEIRPNRQLVLSIVPSYTYGNIEYEDPSQPLEENRRSTTAVHEFRSQIQSRIGDANSSMLTVGADVAEDHVSGTFLPTKSSGSAGFFALGQLRHRWNGNFVQVLNLYPSLRADGYSGRYIVSPRMGASVVNTGRSYLISLRASAGKNFRAPTLNERYWQGDGASGNPRIKAERSSSFDVGVLYTRSNWFADATWFYIHTKDQIVWVPGAISPGVWSPSNLARTSSSGIELTLEHRGASVRTNLDFTYNKALDHSGEGHANRLRYAPLYKVKITNAYSVSRAIFMQETTYTSERWSDVANTVYLDRYWLTNLTAKVALPVAKGVVDLMAGVKNIFNSKYETISQYPGLAREYFVGFSFNYSP